MLDGIKSGDINTIMSGSWFDSEGFTKTMTDKRTWAGTASSMVAAGVTTGLTAANLGNGVNNMGNDFKDAAERNKALLNSADKVSGFNVGQINDMLSMNSFIGSMAGAGVTYAMTGNVSFNVLNASDLTGGALQGGLLQMNLGKDGFSMELGMGGTNVSAGVIASAMRGGQNWDKNTQIKRAAAANNMDVATTLRSQWGYGDAKAKSQLESIIRGDTKLSSGKRDGDAQTVLENGSRVVYLNNYKPGMSTADQLALGITLGHEAHRDGISGQDNYLETRSAVRGHTEMAIRMLRDGQGLSMSANLQNDIGAYMMGQDVFNAYVDGSYDSSADYWKLVSTKDGRHSLEYDGSRDLTIEYKDRGENGEWETVGTDKIADTTGSMAGSLAKILGAERAEELLGQSLHNSNVYDTQTLMDVLGISEDAASQIKDRGALPAEVSELQLLKLAGEALMKNNGFTYDTDTMKWDAGRTTNLTLTDNLTKGYISFNNIDDTNYDRFVVTAALTRNNNSWDATMGTEIQGPLQDYNRGLDSIVYTKYNLQNEVQDWYVTKSVQSIDVFNTMDGKIDRNQAMDSSLFANLQGNTVMTDFSLSIDSLETTDKWAMTIHNARTLDGDWINKAGIDTEPGGAWGLHEGRSLTSDGCFMYRENDLDLLQNKLSTWGMRKNQQIAGIMYNSWYADYIQRTAVKRPR